MAKFKVLAGDLEAIEWSVNRFLDADAVTFYAASTTAHLLKGESHRWTLARVDKLGEEQLRSMTTTAVWAGVGALALGPVGLLAGLLGGKRTEIAVEVHAADGKKVLGVTDMKGYQLLAAAAFKNA